MLTLSPTPFRFPEGSHGRAYLRYHEDVPVLNVVGSPEEIGAAVGHLAVRHAPRMVGYPDELLRHFRSAWMRPVLVWAGEGMVRRFEADIRAEFEAVARAGGIQRSCAVLGNTLFDIKKFLACSALMVGPRRSATGGTLLGRNLDYPSQGFAHLYSLVTRYRPSSGRAFISVGFPGLVGVLSGMNESGLALGVLEVFQSRWYVNRLDLGGTPYAICLRKILQTCDNIEQAHAALGKMRRTTVFNVAIADRDRLAVFEVTPREVRVRQSKKGTCVCTNHFCLDENRPAWVFNLYQTFDRERTLHRVERERGCFDIADIHAGLHATQQGDHTLQTMIFEPRTLRLHVALGQLPSSAGPLRTIPFE